MRIALRTSGGRGEYELAGRQGAVNASDLFEKPLFFEFTPTLVIPGRAIATQAQGKPRIRLQEHDSTTHLHLLLAGVLLMPRPKRELRQTHGTELLRRDSFSVAGVKVDVANYSPTAVVLRPTDMMLQNGDDLAESVSVAERMARVNRLWEEADRSASPLGMQILMHQAAVLAANPDHKQIMRLASDIAEALGTEGDVLAAAEVALGLEAPVGVAGARPVVEPIVDEDETPPEEARVVRVKEWRQVVSRGSKGAKFRRDVRNAYDFRCLFTGQRLPKTEATESAGVDAAHIFPWASHDLDTIRNGLCLSKQCHWALDAGVLRLSYDAAVTSYVIDVPDPVRAAALRAGFDMGFFDGLVGPIPRVNLPANAADWPSPTYLEQVNRFISAS